MARHKGITYQRGTQNQDRPQTSTSKIPAQKDKLLKAIKEPSPNNVVSKSSQKNREKPTVEAY